MLVKPDLEEKRILLCLQGEYGVEVSEITFLPLGADINTAVYRVLAKDQQVFFLKLRSGEFNPASVSVPKFLFDLGISQIIPPLMTLTGQMWANLSSYKTILYPFIEGINGFEKKLSDPQWIEFGRVLKRIHTSQIPAEATRGIKQEDFAPKYRNAVKKYLKRTPSDLFHDPIKSEAKAIIQGKSIEIFELVKTVEQLAIKLKALSLEYILCHGDIHAWNLLLPDDDRFFIVDWDTLVFAPKERDLMFIGGGLGGRGHTPEEEETLFYRGYGKTQVSFTAMAYYRYERIIEDIAIFCEQIFQSDASDEDRQQSLEYLQSNFLPNNVLEIAYQSDHTKENL
jgi:spectinomycin phosphotransferase